MDIKYKVFISSTHDDLIEERSKVSQDLLTLDCMPCAMETFPAAPKDSWTFIKSLIDQCDYFILIVSDIYGSTDEDGISFTEKEYDYAISKQLPILSFVRSDVDSLPTNKKETDPEKRQRLEAFIKKVSERNYDGWNNAENLATSVIAALARLILAQPGTGWIRADQLSAMYETRLSKQKQIIQTLTRQVELIPEPYDDFNYAREHLTKTLDSIVQDKISDNDPVKISVLGVCFRQSFPFIKQYIENNLTSGKKFVIKLSMLDYKSDAWKTLDNQWNDQIKIFFKLLKNLLDTIRKTENANICIELNKYSYMPNWHGLLINNKHLYLSTCHWTDSGTFDVGENPYNVYQKGKSPKHDKAILQFKRWYRFSLGAGSKSGPEILIDASPENCRC